MRKILCLAACGAAINYGFIQHKTLHTEPQPKKESPKPLDLKDIESKYGYDIYLSQLKKYSESDQRKLSTVYKTREEHMANLKNPAKEFDLLIIGGGCNGGGTLLEASSRGLNCALIDRGDFASETSSRSTKLIHGGVRYLQDVFKLERGLVEKFNLVVEGLDERNFMLNTAPYMNTCLEMVIPCTNIFYLGYYYIGVCVYHFLSYFKWKMANYTYKLPRPSFMMKAQMKSFFPMLKGDNYGVKFAEGHMNDARLLIQTLLTASQDNYFPDMKGATLGNYVEFLDFVKNKGGKCVGAKLKDRLDGSEFEVKAKVIVNCAGVFADQIRLKDNPKTTPRIVSSRGVHLMLPHKYTEKDIGILIPKTEDGRVMFILPYRGLTIAGTTDHECKTVSAPTAPEEDIKEISKELSNYFQGDINREYTAAWCGLRPLVLAKPKAHTKAGLYDKFRKLIGRDSSKASTKSLTRSHEVEITESGLVSLMGGKWTAFRRMGQDTVEAILKSRPDVVPAVPSSVTRELRLIGAYTTKTIDKTEKNISEFVNAYKLFLCDKYALDKDVAAHLLELYGTNAAAVAALGADAKLNERLHAKTPLIKAQVVYSVRKELATNIKDVLFRRLGIGFLDKKLTEEMIPVVADVMAEELKWTSEKKLQEIEEAKKNLLTLS